MDRCERSLQSCLKFLGYICGKPREGFSREMKIRRRLHNTCTSPAGDYTKGFVYRREFKCQMDTSFQSWEKYSVEIYE